MNELSVETLRAWLQKERLVLCRENDTAFPLDGLRETEVLNEIVSVIHDAEEWDELTDPMGYVEVEKLRALAKAS